MNRKARPVVLAVGAWLAILGAQASIAQGNCRSLAPLDAGAVRKQFEMVSGEVLGKRVERWTVEDFNSVVAAAAACDRYVTDKRQEIRASTWSAQMEAAARVIIPISTAVLKADDEMAGVLQEAPWLPQCTSMLDWRRTRQSWKNNSADLFGKDFLKMDRKELEYSMRRAASCKEAVNLISKARRASPEAGGLIADDIAYAAERSIEALSEEVGEKVVIAIENGQRIPISYTTQRSRMMVGIVNRAIKIGRPMTPDETTQLTSWADETIAKSGNDADIAYAKAVKESISRQIFRRGD